MPIEMRGYAMQRPPVPTWWSWMMPFNIAALGAMPTSFS
jgi:hypothetical protein